ncbi:hypothetical protein M758_2G181000 [Ceratodon purpureus]|nr:hypothetical protein M758_2G181000 [Ceratodon purpureus]
MALRASLGCNVLTRIRQEQANQFVYNSPRNISRVYTEHKSFRQHENTGDQYSLNKEVELTNTPQTKHVITKTATILISSVGFGEVNHVQQRQKLNRQGEEAST